MTDSNLRELERAGDSLALRRGREEAGRCAICGVVYMGHMACCYSCWKRRACGPCHNPDRCFRYQ